MSRKKNRRRRKDRRERKQAWKTFHEKYPDTGRNMPIFILQHMANQVGRSFAQEALRESRRRNFAGNQLQHRKNELAFQFKSMWRKGVDALEVDGWCKNIHELHWIEYDLSRNSPDHIHLYNQVIKEYVHHRQDQPAENED